MSAQVKEAIFPTCADYYRKGTTMLPTLFKIAQAARELNVCARSVHTYIRKYEEETVKASKLTLPSSPSIGLRPTIIHKSMSGRITRRVDCRDLAEYLENAGREALQLPLNNWRADS